MTAPQAARRSRPRLRAALTVGACAAVLGAFGAAAPVQGAEAARPSAATADVSPLAGADLPFVSQEAEDADHNGTVIGPDHTQGTVASEASGRQAVRIASGQHVEFTLDEPANAITVVYSLQDGASGTLSVYAEGQRLDQRLDVTSRYAYFDAPWIAGSKTHHFFNHGRLLLGQDLAAGDTVTLRVDPGDTAGDYTIDSVDFEQVAAPASPPPGALDVTSLGADPSGQADSTQAFVQAVAQGRGGTVWIPPGTYRVEQPLYVENVTLRGAGNWHSIVRSSRFINQGQSPGDVHLADFAVVGDVTQRVDSDPDNAVNGSLGPGSSVSGLWLQRLKVGLWMTGTNDGLVVEDNRIVDMAADGLNLNGNADDITVRNNYVRNTGDDALAMWSLPQINRDATFDSNTVIQPNLANGIAIYGGENISVTNNHVQDTNALGSGIAISNQAFLQPFFPLAGTITVHGNTLVRTGAMNPNWNHPMSALRVDPYNHPIEADVRITDTTVIDSPWSAFQFVSGGGTGLAADRVTIDGATVRNVGTVVFQAETTGSATISGVTATGVGVTGVYNCPYPTGIAPMRLDDGGGNSGWDGEWTDCSTWPQPGDTPGEPDPDRNLAAGRPVTVTSHTDVHSGPNAVDGNASTYWESANHSFPETLTVDLGAPTEVGRVVLKLPPPAAWETRSQTITIRGGDQPGSLTDLVASRLYTFDPARGNEVAQTLPGSTEVRYLHLVFTANTGWPAGQLAELEAYAS
ncbi:discoidin domain-containing protein [Streptomyces radicis]|uniref:Mycodextranase n=1 Tax=Streptomyces radicis TaxID=1750517 RepID=A0A3A9WL22_9ACTN|nr:discoidin domain-containing protein [Streptomyces radicis]RKN06847.1 mycodextranase [Streptomyces radicis]RKN19465.1 mycodextranase [Streptomyces radicis]